MKRRFNFLAIALLLWGCSIGTVSNSSLKAPLSDITAKTPVVAHGTLTVSFKWPTQSLYRTNIIPTTTDRATLEVTHDSEVLIPEEDFEKTGSVISTKSVEVPAMNGVTVMVRAYRGETKIAEGSAIVNVQPSKNAQAPIHLTSLYTPTITSLQNNHGVSGETIIISGTNLGGTGIPVEVYFNGTKAETVNPINGTDIQVTVPTGATTGNLMVKVDGVFSTSNAVFWVPNSLLVSFTKESWDVAPANECQILYEHSKQFTVEPTWVVKNGETLSLDWTPPNCTWNAIDSTVGTLTQQGLFTAKRVSQAVVIRAQLGSVLSNQITLTPGGYEGLSLDQSSLTLNAMPENGPPAENFITSSNLIATPQYSTPYFHGVAWESSDTSLVTVTNGLVQTVPGALEGTAIITASLVDDPTILATASVTVTINGDLQVEVQ